MIRILDRYEAYLVRRMVPRRGEERARREAPALARANAVIIPWIIVIVLASLARAAGSPGVSLVLYLLALAWLPLVIIAWAKLRRARNP
jgi:hypothetical protein